MDKKSLVDAIRNMIFSVKEEPEKMAEDPSMQEMPTEPSGETPEAEVEIEDEPSTDDKITMIEGKLSEMETKLGEISTKVDELLTLLAKSEEKFGSEIDGLKKASLEMAKEIDVLGLSPAAEKTNFNSEVEKDINQMTPLERFRWEKSLKKAIGNK